MDVNEMLEREDLLGILKSTVEHFFNDIYGGQIFLYKDSAKDRKPVYLMARPGLFATYPLAAGAIQTILTEYTLRGSCVRYISARVYIMLRLMFITHYSVGKLYVEKKHSKQFQSVLVVPNNKSIRVFDYSSGKVYSVVKNGFSNKFMKNQINFRKNNKYNFVLPVIDSGNDWFVEKILNGHSLARVRKESEYSESINEAIKNIKLLFKNTSRKILIREYNMTLSERVKFLTSQLKCKNESKEIIRKILSLLIGRLDVYKDDYISVGMTHGDFQSGNIWRDDNGNTIIYDWETVGIRSEWYDTAVMFEGLRTKRNYADLWDNTLGTKCETKHITLVKMIVILEDIIFHLEEIEALPIDCQSRMMDHLIITKIIGLEDTLNG